MTQNRRRISIEPTKKPQPLPNEHAPKSKSVTKLVRRSPTPVGAQKKISPTYRPYDNGSFPF